MKSPLVQLFARSVSEVMRLGIPKKYPPHTPLREVVRMLQTSQIGSLVIVKDSRVVGIFTERDFLTKIGCEGEKHADKPISSFMTPNPVCIAQDASLAAVLRKMRVGKFRHMLIVDSNQQLLAILSLRDIMNFFVRSLEEAAKLAA